MVFKAKEKIIGLPTFFIVASFVVLLILIPYTFYRNGKAVKCVEFHQKEGCAPTTEESWCYQWKSEEVFCDPSYEDYCFPEDPYDIWSTPVRLKVYCSGKTFSNEEECRIDAIRNCPSKISWKYTIIAGTPILIAAFLLLAIFFL